MKDPLKWLKSQYFFKREHLISCHTITQTTWCLSFSKAGLGWDGSRAQITTLCSREGKGLQACKLQSLVGRKGEGPFCKDTFFTMLNLTPGVYTHTHTNSMWLLSTKCVYAYEQTWVCVCERDRELNNIFSSEPLWAQKPFLIAALLYFQTNVRPTHSPTQQFTTFRTRITSNYFV